ncbi:hypothetical protein [Ottowia testudinis]|uniref:Internal virion protein C n=1 Tax=Ottowia testudinis TaxID=2816950 RepID=A0A975CIV6_9BURK|nr:hypothetical protein [Ottowia testudinis]QTD44218.1 hypothetical protein J1M35_13930 [Ottowia testudinis]
MAHKYKEQKDDEEKLRAQRTANSMTVGELGKKIQAGEMLASESPVFAATLQNIFGSNSQAALERDVVSKITTGELKFNSPEEMDLYVTEQRNSMLAGHSKYAAAGFDRNHAAMRQKFMDASKQFVDKQAVEAAAGQATDALSNTLLKVTAADFTGNHQDAAATILKDYELLRKSYTLPPGADRQALADVLHRAAAGGHKELVAAILDSPEKDLGTVRNILGSAKADTLLAHAEGKYDGAMRKQVDDEKLPFLQDADAGRLNEEKLSVWYRTNAKYVTSDTYQSIVNRNRAALEAQQRQLAEARMLQASEASIFMAQKAVEAALSDGRLHTVQGTANPQVLSRTGTYSDFGVTDYAQQYAARATQGMPLPNAASVYASNNLDNPDWKNKMLAGLSNFASLAGATPGKPVGELNKEAKESITLFKELHRHQPAYLKGLLGDGAYRQYVAVNALTKNGGMPDNVAASLVASAERGDVLSHDGSNQRKLVEKEVAAMQANPWYKSKLVQRWLGDNTVSNSVEVTGLVRTLADLYVRSGQFPDAESAVGAAAQYVADPTVSARVNGTTYLRSEMPQAPKGEQQDVWFDRFITDVPKALAKAQGFKGSEVRMAWDNSINGYRAWVVNTPLTDPDTGLIKVFTKSDIEDWYATERKKDIDEATSNITTPELRRPFGVYRARLEAEMTKDVKVHTDVLRNHKRLLSEGTFAQIVKDGNQDKPLAELIRLYPSATKPTPTP